MRMKPVRVLLLAGGRSEEHDVSLVSARSMLAALKQSAQAAHLHIDVQVIGRQGLWLSPSDSHVCMAGGKSSGGGHRPLYDLHLTSNYDVVFPLLHGPFGEDGTIQGMLEMARMPYIGSGVLASALCMDKIMTKQVLHAQGVPQVPYATVTRTTFKKDPQTCLAQLRDTFMAHYGPPWFVKPANLGSSVGISKVDGEAGLHAAINSACALDRRVIIEQGVAGVRELEVGVIGNSTPETSVVGEITHDREFYDYKAKYTPGHATMHIPAELDAGVAKRVQTLAAQCYALLDCAGLARFDFFYQQGSGALYVNEVNTMPGFTPFSMFPKMWEATGVDYGSLIQKLVDLALDNDRVR